MLIIKIVAAILGVYLSLYSVFWFITTLLGVNFKTKAGKSAAQPPSVLILLPAYKPGKIFFKVLEQAQKLKNKHKNIEVLCLMQHAEKAFSEKAQEMGFMVKAKTFDHLPGNSYHHALQYLVEQMAIDEQLKAFDPCFVLILDKDNLIDDQFLGNIPYSFFHKYQVIQGRRTAMDSESSTGYFDQISESLNDVMFRSANSRLGFLPEVSGSAALIRTDIFSEAILNLDPKAPGYDKNFMIQLLSGKRIKGIYVPESKIVEEKTQEIAAHQPQRVRWFGEQYYNALYSFGKLLKSAFKGNWSAFLYLIILWRPPRSIQLIVVPILGLAESIGFLFTGSWLLGYPLMVISTLLLLASVLIFLMDQNLLGPAFKYSLKLPGLVFSNFFSAASSIQRKNQGKFIHTEHKL